METFSAFLALCAGNSPVTGEFPSQRPVTRSFEVFFDLRPKKGSANNREAGDLRRHSSHYDVIVMYSLSEVIVHSSPKVKAVFHKHDNWYIRFARMYDI